MTRKKSSASSRPAIFSKPVSKAQKEVVSRIAKRQAAGDDSGIDYSDIPPLTNGQLKQFRTTPKAILRRVMEETR